MDRSHSPLLPQVKTILGRMGYAPVHDGGALFLKKGVLGQPLAVEFFRVSERDVQKIGAWPVEKPLTHTQFVTANVQYLFPEV